MTAVGITTIAARPGTGIGTTSGIAKNIREVPKELAPIALTIFSTVKSSTPGLFAKISRRICEVRFFSVATTFLVELREPFRVVVLETLGELFRADDRFTVLVRAAVLFDFAPGLSRIVCVRAADALMGFCWIVSIFVDQPLMSSRRTEISVNTTEIVCKLFIAFCSMLWNAPAMPRRKVALSGLLAFGAGVAVGANWPRAGNIVGYLLQRLGFELTGLTLWMWDPEKSLANTSEIPRLARSTAKKKAQADPRPDGSPLHQKSHPNAKQRTRSPRVRSDEGNRGGTGKGAIRGKEAWIFNSRLDDSCKPGSRSGRMKSHANGIQFEPEKIDLQNARKKPKGAAVNNQRKSPGAQRAGKAGSFPGNAVPADAALN